MPGEAPLADAASVLEASRPFYRLSAFSLYKRKTLDGLSPYLAVSANYFNPRWTGERRLKVRV